MAHFYLQKNYKVLFLLLYCYNELKKAGGMIDQWHFLDMGIRTFITMK